MYTWTVDVEHDFGGRTSGDRGIKEGLPIILKEFRDRDIKALFFISTELIRDYKTELRKITQEGHELGSHGHFHINYHNLYRTQLDLEISRTLLPVIGGSTNCQYRAPKFNFTLPQHRYSRPDGHVGLLKHVWTGKMIKNPIFYLHPFDIVKGEKPPNLFCRIWYSRPKRAYETFINLLNNYPGSHRLKQV